MNIMISVAKKGVIEEIFSKAKFSDNPTSYKVFFRDLDTVREISLPDFITESKNFENIPVTRIKMIKKDNKILFKK